LFSAVFPWVSALAVINNIAEQRSDAFKYCRLNKRPFPRATTGIGTWIMAFEIIGLISVMSNFALISLHPEVREIFKDYNDTQYILLFVAIEVRILT
jgi:anoctamin-10